MNLTLEGILIAVFAPFLPVLIGVLFNNQRIARLETRMDAMQNQSHADALLILKSMTDLHERVAKVETRQGL